MILVVGAKGFLGSELCKNLKINKKKFVKIDSNFKGKNKIDIRNYNSLENFFKKYSIKIIINCACEPATSKSENKINETNQKGNLNLIKLGEKFKVKKFIFFSTSAIFVKDYKKPLSEKAQPSPIEAYGESKVKAEKDIINSKLNNWAIFRIPMIVSKNRLGVLSILFDLILSNKKIPILGDGKNLLQFIHLNDLIRFIIKSISIKEKEIFNLASDESITLKKLFENLITSVKSKSKIIYFKDFGITKILTLLNYLKLSPLNIYHLKMLKFSLVLDASKVKTKYKIEPKNKTSDMIIEALMGYRRKKKFKNLTEITSPIKMSFLKLIYYFF